jgi:hypothetical protein
MGRCGTHPDHAFVVTSVARFGVVGLPAKQTSMDQFQALCLAVACDLVLGNATPPEAEKEVLVDDRLSRW